MSDVVSLTGAATELVEQHLRPWAVTALDTLANAAEWEPYRSVFGMAAELLSAEAVHAART